MQTLLKLHPLTLVLPFAMLAAAPIFGAGPPGAGREEKMARSVTVYRDTWGVPHVFGPTDASVVFGLAYAQAEDNFEHLEDNFIRSLGRGA